MNVESNGINPSFRSEQLNYSCVNEVFQSLLSFSHLFCNKDQQKTEVPERKEHIRASGIMKESVR